MNLQRIRSGLSVRFRPLGRCRPRIGINRRRNMNLVQLVVLRLNPPRSKANRQRQQKQFQRNSATPARIF